MASTICALLQIIVPATLLIGAAISFIKRGQAKSLFGHVEEGGLRAVRELTWTQFEQLIGEAFRRRGFEVLETGGRSADGGVDLVLKRDGGSYLVQCKHWRTRQVGVGVVRELNGMIAARKAAGGYVVTGGSFTRDAWHFAQDSGLELIDGEKLESLIREVERKRAEATVGGASAPPIEGLTLPAGVESIACSKCGSAMVRRVAKQGAYAGRSFWGCSRYPACRGVQNLTL